jgi:hypothetical protein
MNIVETKPNATERTEWKIVATNGKVRTSQLGKHIKFEVKVGISPHEEWNEVQHIMKETK